MVIFDSVYYIYFMLYLSTKLTLICKRIDVMALDIFICINFIHTQEKTFTSHWLQFGIILKVNLVFRFTNFKNLIILIVVFYMISVRVKGFPILCHSCHIQPTLFMYYYACMIFPVGSFTPFQNQ